MRLMIEVLIVCLVCIVVVEFATTAEQTMLRSNTTEEPTTDAPITTSIESSTLTIKSTEFSTSTQAPPMTTTTATTTPTTANKISPSPMLTTAQQKACECRHEARKLTAVEYALIAVGGFLLLVMIVVVVLFLCCRRRFVVHCARERVDDKLDHQLPMCPLPSLPKYRKPNRKPNRTTMESTTPTDKLKPHKQEPVKQELYMQQPYNQTPFNTPFASPALSPLNDDDGLVPFLTPEELRAQETAKNAQHNWPNAYPW